MHKLEPSLSAMLVIVIKRGYLCYILSLCYVVFALMAAFCLDCSRVIVHPRTRRGTSGFVCGNSCDNCTDLPNGCIACDQASVKSYLHLDYHSQRSYCVHRCPDGYYNHHSDKEGDSCKACGVGCRTCDYASTCNTCMDNFYYYEHACYRHCPVPTKPCRNNNTCLVEKRKKKPKCSLRNESCCMVFHKCMSESDWTCAKKRERKQIKSKCRKRKKICKKRSKKKSRKCKNRINCRSRRLNSRTRPNDPTASRPNIRNLSN